MSLVNPFLNQTIDTISSSTRDAYNKLTLSTVYENVPCRWEHLVGKAFQENKRSGILEAEYLEYRIMVWIPPDYTDIKTDYIVTQDSKQYRIKNIEKNYNLEGELDHIVLYLL